MNKAQAWSFLGRSAWILVILSVPIGGFLLHTYGQLGEAESRNLRNLARAAQAIELLIVNSEQTVRNLVKQPNYACEFLHRQTRLDLVSPDSCAGLDRPDSGLATFLESGASGEVYIRLGVTDASEQEGIRFRVQLDALLAEIPVGQDFDLLLVANSEGKVIARQAGTSNLQQSRQALAEGQDPVRVVQLGELARPGGETLKIQDLLVATSVHSVSISGVGYRLLCQPLAVTQTGAGQNAAHPFEGRWVLCGVIDQSQRLRDALLIAPQLVIGLVALVLLALFIWPIVKFVTVTPRERTRFADVYFLLVGTWGALMLATLLVVAFDSHRALKKSQRSSLKSLAGQVEDNLMTELRLWQAQLQEFDGRLGQAMRGATGIQVTDAAITPDPCSEPAPDPDQGAGAPRLRLAAEERDVTGVLSSDDEVPPWARPGRYPYFDSAFWMRPCDGQQFVKLTVRRRNTPPVKVGTRDYFKAVQTGRLWSLAPPGPGASEAGVFMQSFRSMTTGEFSAALSMRSVLDMGRMYCDGFATSWSRLLDENPQCGGTGVVAMAISGKPVTTSQPLLPPGVGFAIIDSDGTVVFHSDERRALFENFYDEIDAEQQIAAAVRARAALPLHTSYGARPHQLHIQPMRVLPWTVVAFADDQVLRTNHIEILMSGGVLVIAHLLAYFVMTVLYLVVRGRGTPCWLWPYLSADPANYAWLTWLLANAALGSLVIMQQLSGPALLWVGFVSPLAPILALIISPRVLAMKRAAQWVRWLSVVGASAAVLVAVAACGGAFGADSPGITAPLLVAGLVVLWLAGLVWAVLPERLRGVISSRMAPKTKSAAVSVPWRLNLCRLGHMSAAFIIWIAIAVIPAWGYAKFAIAEQLDVLVRHENIHALKSLQDRNAAVEDYYRGIDLGAEYLAQRTTLDQRDIYWSTMYWPRELGLRTARAPQDAHGHSACPGDGVASRQLPSRSNLKALFSEWVVQPPIYNPTAQQMRHLAQAGSGLGEWYYPSRGTAVEDTVVADMEFCSGPGGLDAPLYLRSRLPIAGAHLGWASLAGSFASALLLVAWVRFGTRRLLFGEIPVTPSEEYFEGLFSGRVRELTPCSAPAVGRRLGKFATALWFERELAACPAARRLADKERRSLYEGVTRREALERLATLEEAHYGALWKSCTPDEQLVLVQLAREGLANPKQQGAVRHLLARRLLVRNPVLQVMNQSFALFALRACTPEALADLERSLSTRFDWRHLKWALLVGVGAIIAFLWMTQPTAVDSIVAYLTAAAVGAGALLRFVTATGQLGGKTEQS